MTYFTSYRKYPPRSRARFNETDEETNMRKFCWRWRRAREKRSSTALLSIDGYFSFFPPHPTSQSPNIGDDARGRCSRDQILALVAIRVWAFYCMMHCRRQCLGHNVSVITDNFLPPFFPIPSFLVERSLHQFVLLLAMFIKPMLLAQGGTQSGGAMYRRVVKKNILCTVCIVFSYVITTLVVVLAMLASSPEVRSKEPN